MTPASFPIPVAAVRRAYVVLDGFSGGIEMLAGDAGVWDRHRDPFRLGPLPDVLFPVVGPILPLGARPDSAPAVVPPDAVASIGVQPGGNLAGHEPFGHEPADLRRRVRLVDVVEDHLPQRLLVPVAPALRR